MKKAIPIGVNSYQKLREEEYYTVDKSMMIAEFLERKTTVTLITRPRRFGKTINMSMLADFFDITKDSRDIFKDTAIMQTEYADVINSYPTIFLSFADAKGDKNNIVMQMKLQLLKEYKKNKNVLANIDMFEKPEFDIIMSGLSDLQDNSLHTVVNAISFLMTKCHQSYGKRVMLFIDEYDTPFIEAHALDFYEELRNSLASMLHTSLKTSNDLQYAMLTGIQRVAKENIFSDLNNLLVCTVNDSRYAQYFGFTEEEVKAALQAYDIPFTDEIKQMYDGYNMGGTDIYNPWSIINYLDRRQLIPYWVNTSSNTMIKNAMKSCDKVFQEGYEKLIENDTVTAMVNFETSFYELKETSSLWGLFVNAGYLTVAEEVDLLKGVYRLRIPNQEVVREFQSLTAAYLQISENTMFTMFHALQKNDWVVFLQEYQKVLLTNTSYHDLQRENSYHMLLLGMCMWLRNYYDIVSNREQGEGRYDIFLQSKHVNQPSLMFELKFTKDQKVDLQQLAESACNQMHEKHYAAGIGDIILIGLAHRGKQVSMHIQ
ncbi:MAG: AAA family ATPase [Clostridium sp.]|nr:AAA family ATPase [Clostridium sp.]